MKMGSHMQEKTHASKVLMMELSCFDNKSSAVFTFLPSDYPYQSHHTDSTYDLSTLSEGVKISDLEQLKTDAVKCLADSLFKKLLDVEEVRSYWNEYALIKLMKLCPNLNVSLDN